MRLHARAWAGVHAPRHPHKPCACEHPYKSPKAEEAHPRSGAACGRDTAALTHTVGRALAHLRSRPPSRWLLALSLSLSLALSRSLSLSLAPVLSLPLSRARSLSQQGGEGVLNEDGKLSLFDDDDRCAVASALALFYFPC